MSTEITTAFVKQFGANVFHLSQQKGSRLRSMVRNETVKGESRFFDRIGKATTQRRTTRHADTPISNTPHSRRRVVTFPYEFGDLVDDSDKVRTLNDPTNDYSVAAQWALGRDMDQNIIDAASDVAYSAVDGGTQVSLPTTQKIASVASTAGARLNVDALIHAAGVLDANEVDESEPRGFAYNSWQKQGLLGQTQVQSADYNSIKALVSGQIDTFMGFKFVRLELLNNQSGSLTFDSSSGAYSGGGTVNTDTYDKCIAWAKMGLLLGVGADIKAKIAERADKSFSTQVYASMDIGATRMEEEKVVEVHCKED